MHWSSSPVQQLVSNSEKERLIQLLVSIILIEFCLALVSLFIVVPCTINT